ncbi:hydantoin racemase [Hirsutella rhossiliensis]|uniref:Hydantoin racemase n=1 Tax=Hirsutella rhossiliensis TaxID=111463 RepID=A0A9P8MN92_9HYPO|nr:hydantoin racemase [Hirsutella rhossiliensis]KAH0958134.1 hydantoin racemase [Hirsutella rhossiliensis]
MAAATSTGGGNMRILLLNPNSSITMTQSMALAAQETPVSQTIKIDTYTAPAQAPASINDDVDIKASTTIILDGMGGLNLDKYDAVLVACFSVHSLVAQLSVRHPRLAVTGIFEASILSALSLVSSDSTGEQWGILTTGDFWEKHLADGVSEFLGRDGNAQDRKFCGVYSTGLTAGDFHTVSPDEIRAKLRAATTQLVRAGNVACVVMGCGGMAGLEDIIRSAARDVYGHERADKLYVVDGVKAGILQLHQTINSRYTFR